VKPALTLIAALCHVASAEAVMKIVGVARLPHSNLDDAQMKSLPSVLEQMGLFECVKPIL